MSNSCSADAALGRWVSPLCQVICSWLFGRPVSETSFY
jgi:hypothetical protein